ncbi:putative thymidine kinase [Vibrio phage VP3]|uniref:Thymidine kinase n=1 Tax=Vibrio phage VP3 TaxID=588068 RepID=H9YAG8_9CAUD|nr:thymidine kinase [Vibrio phage VP4]AFH14420.1 putative thymidine kinase [Vibrio phage VP3]
MGKLVYHFGAMKAGKSAKLLQMAYQIDGKKSMGIYTTQDSCNHIESRLGISRSCKHIDELFLKPHNKYVKFIFIDECQWLKAHHIKKLREIADRNETEIHCFGLRSDFKGDTFPASNLLFLLADEFEHLPSYCDHCDCAAILHNKQQGEGKEAFESVCYEHFKGEI